MRTRWWLVAVGFTLAVGLGAQRAEAIVILDVIADAYIEDFAPGGVLDGVPDSIHDTNALLPGFGTLSSGAAIDARAITVFNLSPYAGMTLSSAVLSGFGGRVDARGSTDPVTATFLLYVGDGLISLDDFNRVATFQGGVSFPVAQNLPDDLVAFELPVTSGIQTLLNGSDPYAEFRIEADLLTAYISAGDVPPPFQQDRGVTGPRLSLTFAESGPIVPEPGSWMLFLGGLSGLGLTHRRRR